MVSLKAASRSLVSRSGAGRALSKRVNVGECFLASFEVAGMLSYARLHAAVSELAQRMGRGYVESAMEYPAHRVFSASIGHFSRQQADFWHQEPIRRRCTPTLIRLSLSDITMALEGITQWMRACIVRKNRARKSSKGSGWVTDAHVFGFLDWMHVHVWCPCYIYVRGLHLRACIRRLLDEHRTVPSYTIRWISRIRILSGCT